MTDPTSSRPGDPRAEPSPAERARTALRLGPTVTVTLDEGGPAEISGIHGTDVPGDVVVPASSPIAVGVPAALEELSTIHRNRYGCPGV